ncbi:MAG: hypothetical protein KJ737_24450 [Proteobacteria bacterium]|nr:hypothetical protein [Pseudomonadota bacterium]
MAMLLFYGSLGSDYPVKRATVLDTLATIFNQKRIIVKPPSSDFQAFDESLTSSMPYANNRQAVNLPDMHLLMALAIPIWFAEHVRKIKRY